MNKTTSYCSCGAEVCPPLCARCLCLIVRMQTVHSKDGSARYTVFDKCAVR